MPISTHLRERQLFLKQALQDLHEVGSIIPSSQVTAKAMTAAFRRRTAPARVLEVGAGTGPITARIARELKPGDFLDAYEINPDYGAFLARRFEEEPDLRAVRDQVALHTADILQIEKVPQYDYIISAIPFTAFPATAVAEFFETYRQILKPNGTLTYIEFAFGRHVMRILTRKEDEKARIRAVARVVDEYVDQYQVNHKFVLFNAPPARIRSLQFSSAK
jgi:phospholipid N-methyltransferase